MKKLFKILLAFFAFCFITFAFIMPLNPPVGNWYQQFMPNIGGRSVQDVFFLDSLTGWAVTNATNQSPDTTYVLKTTNSGDSWSIHYRNIQTGGGFSGYFKIYFLNQNTGYVCDVLHINKTTDGGSSWVSLNAPITAYLDMSVLSTDTIWIVTPDSFAGGVFRTTNGGASWQNQLNLGSQNPAKIYMYSGRIGFTSTGAGLYKTTNSGTNWGFISWDGAFSDMFFIDSLTGWKASGFMRKTTDGGINWVNQTLPSGGNIIVTSIEKFSNVNKDTIWGVSGYSNTGSGARGMIYRTTNGGDNWLYQIPDSSFNIFRYLHIESIGRSNIWAYNPARGIHTTNGGDTTFYMGIVQTSSNIPKDFELKQNYPNPFNPRTVIPYSIKSAAYVKLIAYDILGRENQKLVDQHQSAGEYEVDFIGKFASSGVYFYRIEVIDDRSKQLFTETKKMLLIK